MTTFADLQSFFARQKLRLIIASDAEPITHREIHGKIVQEMPSGGVGITFDSIAKATNATFIVRGKNEEEKRVQNTSGKIVVGDEQGKYTIKRLFFTTPEMEAYYYGFANQTLWPLCHITFERPEFNTTWFEGYKKVNKQFADAILKENINKNTFIWINDYQLCLVPKLLGKTQATVAMFWHIPWPTWEIFRILPNKTEILESMLRVQFLAFHRGYHVRNFLDTVQREFAVRVDEETNTVYYKGNKTVVRNLPLGIDTQVVRSIIDRENGETTLTETVKKVLTLEKLPKKTNHEKKIEGYFTTHKVILGVDRLDYTKGLLLRLRAIDLFFAQNKAYIEKVIYLGILAPSRQKIPAYQQLRKEVYALAKHINDKWQKGDWKPIFLIVSVFPRPEVIHFYHKADVCLVTPRDDGMNIVSKEFVVASSMQKNPGMLVLSRFAGSAIDLTESLIVNPYDIDEVAKAIATALAMPTAEKSRRMKKMAETLEDRNVYQWAMEFVRSAINAGK